jgi:hypothetical protein
MANVSINGNVTDSVMVFGNNNYVVKIGDVNGGVVNIVKPSDKPKYSARPAPVTIKPRAFPSLLDRENEFEIIKKAAQLSAPVSVWGQAGIGKTSFIRHLTHVLDMGNFTSGMVYLNAAGLGYEDLLQALFDLFFDSASSYKPATAEILHALQGIKALIFLDDLHIGRDEAASMLDAAPGSLFLLSSTERNLWGEGEAIQLRGLPESESLKLFEKELSRPLSDQEKPTAIKICSALQGHPLQILQAAALARENGKSLENLLAEISGEKTENKSMAYVGLAHLSASEKQILALLAAAGGHIVPQEHINGIFKGGANQKDLQRLTALGLVQSHSPRYSISDTLVSAISTAWDITSWQDVLLNHAINWLGQQPASALVEESSGLLIHTIKSAGERKKWREVIQLGRLLEKFMVYYKRWQAWMDILNLILTAAKALKDSKVTAWALHQLGSRALYLGHASEAKAFLTQALNIRQVIGDKAGAAITQHNINTLNGIIAPLKGSTSGCRKYLGYGCGGAIGLVVLAVMAWIGFNLITPNTPPTEMIPTRPTITRTNTSSPTPSVTPTDTPTATMTPTETFTPTATPTPVLLYDFVVNADDAYWYEDGNGESAVELKFLTEPLEPNPEFYLSTISDGYGYAGWDFDVPMVKEKNRKQVILAYPYYQYDQIIGEYTPFFDKPHPDTYLEVKVGYKDVPADDPVGVTFRIYLNEKLVFEESSTLEKRPVIYIPNTPVNVFEGVNVFRLEVDAADGVGTQDYPIWAIVKLWEKKP